MTADEKLRMIREICKHPGAFHWSGREMANTISRVIDENAPIPFTLSEIDEPIHYELAHDAVAEEFED